MAVNTAAGSSNTLPLTVNPVPSAPTLTAMNPNSGARGTSVNVVLTGTNFTPSTSARLGGSGASMANLAVVSSTQINITFVLSPTAATGTHNVYVTNSTGSSAILPFTIY